MDIVSENISKLKELFPDVFSEGKIDFKALEAALGLMLFCVSVILFFSTLKEIRKLEYI